MNDTSLRHLTAAGFNCIVGRFDYSLVDEVRCATASTETFDLMCNMLRSYKYFLARPDIEPLLLMEPPLIEPPLIEPPLIEPPLMDPPLIEPPLIEPPLIEPPLIDPVGVGAGGGSGHGHETHSPGGGRKPPQVSSTIPWFLSRNFKTSQSEGAPLGSSRGAGWPTSYI